MLPLTEPGTHQVCAYAIGAATNPTLGCKTIQVTGAFGVVDSFQQVAGDVRVRGWALNPAAPAEPVAIHVYDFGAQGAVGWAGFAAGGSRVDVGHAYPGYGDDHGFDVQIALTGRGVHQVCVYAVTGSGSVTLGCGQITN